MKSKKSLMYSDYDNKRLADMIPARQTTFRNDEDSQNEFVLLEVTDQNFDMIEVKIQENTYLTFRLSDLLRSVESNRLNYSH